MQPAELARCRLDLRIARHLEEGMRFFDRLDPRLNRVDSGLLDGAISAYLHRQRCDFDQRVRGCPRVAAGAIPRSSCSYHAISSRSIRRSRA